MEPRVTRRVVLRAAAGAAATGLSIFRPGQAHAGERINTGTTLTVSPTSAWYDDDAEITLTAKVHKQDKPDPPGDGLEIEFHVNNSDSPGIGRKITSVSTNSANPSTATLRWKLRSELQITGPGTYSFFAVFPAQTSKYGEDFNYSRSDGANFESRKTPQPSGHTWVNDLEDHYMDQYGLVATERIDGNPNWASGNALLYTSLYYIARLRESTFTSTSFDRFTKAVRTCQADKPGHFYRHPRWDRNDFPAHDDVIGLTTASYLMDNSAGLAREIYDYLDRHNWVYNKSDRPLFPYVKTHVTMAAKLSHKLNIFDVKAWEAAMASTLEGSTRLLTSGVDQFHETWVLNWLMTQVVDSTSPGTIQGGANDFRNLYYRVFPQGLGPVLNHWWGSSTAAAAFTRWDKSFGAFLRLPLPDPWKSEGDHPLAINFRDGNNHP
jgi:hypothetical protein